MDASGLPPADAARQLNEVAGVRARVEQRADDRAYGWIQLWSGVLAAAYVGAFLTVQAVPRTSAPWPILVLPVLVACALVPGAHARLRVRRQPTAGQLALALAAVLVPFAVLAGLHVAGLGYPWWLGLLVALLALVVVSGPGVRLIRRGGREPAAEPWRNRPLTTTARVTTVGIRLYLGVLGGTGLLSALDDSPPWGSAAFAVVTILSPLVLVGYLVGWSASWGLARVGSEWGPWHWLAFGAALALNFTLALLGTVTSSLTVPVPLGAGVLIALPVTVTAFLPARHGRG